MIPSFFKKRPIAAPEMIHPIAGLDHCGRDGVWEDHSDPARAPGDNGDEMHG